MRSLTDYILGTNCRLFENFSARYPRHNSDHYMVLGCLNRSALREHARYLGENKRLPFRPPTDRPDEGGRNLCGPTEVRPEASGTGRKEEHVDLGGHVETCQGERLRAPRSRKGSGPHSEVEPRDCSKLEGRQAMSGQVIRSGGGAR